MEKDKTNKGYVPQGNKRVKIRFLPGRFGEGAEPQIDGTHLASEENAKYWVSIGYAELVEEGE